MHFLRAHRLGNGADNFALREHRPERKPDSGKTAGANVVGIHRFAVIGFRGAAVFREHGARALLRRRKIAQHRRSGGEAACALPHQHNGAAAFAGIARHVVIRENRALRRGTGEEHRLHIRRNALPGAAAARHKTADETAALDILHVRGGEVLHTLAEHAALRQHPEGDRARELHFPQRV